MLKQCPKSVVHLKHKLLSAVFTASLLSALGASLPLFSNPALAVSAETVVQTREGETIPEDETSLNGSGLEVKLASSTHTDSSQSFRISMTSTSTTGYNNGARRKNVYVVVDDPDFNPNASVAEGKELPRYHAHVHWIDFSTGAEEIFIPQQVTSASKFVLLIDRVAETACYTQQIMTGDAQVTGTEADYGYSDTACTKIYIPSAIETVDAGAFAHLPESISIALQADVVPAGFEAGWTDAAAEKVLLGQEIKRTDVVVNVSATMQFGKASDYLIGYYAEDEYYAPLLISYNTVDQNGAARRQNLVKVMEKMALNNDYDGLGSTVGSQSVFLNADIDIEDGEWIDPHSLVIHNIYAPVRIEKDNGTIGFRPDLEEAFCVGIGVPDSIKIVDLDDVCAFKTTRVSTFGNRLQVDVAIDVAKDYYEKLNPAMYEANKADLESGDYSTRVLFTALRQAEYRLTFKGNNGQNIVRSGRTATPVDFYILENGKVNTVGFMIDCDWVNGLEGEGEGRFNYDSLVSIDLVGFSLKVDIWMNKSRSSLNKSDSSFRFGAVHLLPEEQKAAVGRIDLVTYYLISSGIYIVLAVAFAAGYFFYASRRFRNDEFRRVVPKKYWISAAKNVVGFGIVALAILSIVARWGIMNTSIVAYNPIDVFVIIFTIAGGIFLGFAIRSLVMAIRNGMKRRSDARLHLDQDAVEDGTK